MTTKPKPTNNSTKTVEFPPTDIEGEAKLKRFLATTGEFMKAEIETVTILRAVIPANRGDLYTVLSRIAKAQKD